MSKFERMDHTVAYAYSSTLFFIAICLRHPKTFYGLFTLFNTRMSSRPKAIMVCRFKENHQRDWEFVSDTLGVEPVQLEAGRVAGAWRKRAVWASFPMLELLRRRVAPEQILEEGRMPSWRWRERLPTVMASGPQSWNQKCCVETWTGQRWEEGPLRVGEVEQLMGFRRGITEGVFVEDVELSHRQRWRALGNAIHASVMCHIMVSALVTRGYITRDSHLIQSQPWTMDLDGPASSPSWEDLIAGSKELLEQARSISKRKRGGETGTGSLVPAAATRVAAVGPARVVPMVEKAKKESGSKR